MPAPPVPPVPPRPFEMGSGSGSHSQQRNGGGPPPIPPLPADLRIQAEKYVTPSRYELETPAHLVPPPPPPLQGMQGILPIAISQTPAPIPTQMAIPLMAPRPTRMDKSVPVNMARRLDEEMREQQLQQQQKQQLQQQQLQQRQQQLQQQQLQQQQLQLQQQQQLQQLQQQKTINYTPGFIVPSVQGGWQAPAPIGSVDLATAIANLAIQPSAPFPVTQPQPQSQQQNMQTLNVPAIAQSSSSGSSSGSGSSAVASSAYPASSSSSVTSLSSSSTSAQQQQQQQQQQGPPSLTAALPSLAQLSAAWAQIQQPTHDPLLRLAWARDVFLLLDRAQGSPTDPPVGPIHIPDPVLSQLARAAVPLVLQLAGSWSPSQAQAQGSGGGGAGKMPAHVAEAIYWRAMCASSGAFPDYVRHNPRTAFRDFEAAARGGYAPAWFRLGRDYENFSDHTRAKECFERGAKAGVESCLYRLGMAHLLGQLGFPANASTALPLLHRSALLSSLTCPQPAYVFALLLLSEFTSVPPLPPTLLSPFIPPSSSPTLEARKHLERAAFLHFAAAQYKIGHAYEFAEPPFGFDPLLSVQYYSLASEQGEGEADMALSKWFLCGSGGAAHSSSSSSSSSGGFEKDEALALTFAEKAAKKGLPSAEFAMGYYAEVGVGQPRDIARALEWYRLAESHGNTDAPSRLLALTSSSSNPASQALSRSEHESLTESKLVRRRTMAAQRAESEPMSPPWEGRVFPSARVWEEGGGLPPGQGQGLGQGQQAYGVPPPQQQQQQQQQPAALRKQRQDPRMVVDVIRKNSLASGYAPVSVVGGGGDPSGMGLGGFAGVGAGGPGAGAGAGGRPFLEAGRREQSPQRLPIGAAPPQLQQQQQQRGDSPQRLGQPQPVRGRYDSRVGQVGQGTGSITPPSSYGRGRESPGRVVGGRAQSPAGIGRLPIAASGSPGGGGGGAQGQGQGRSKLERMRLNLDDPPPASSIPPSSSSSSASANATANGSSSTSVASGINTSVPLVTPGGVGGVGATPTPATARPGGGGGGAGGAGGSSKAQTFADMGIVGAKVEDKDCVIM